MSDYFNVFVGFIIENIVISHEDSYK